MKRTLLYLNVLVVVLSIYVLAALAADTFFTLPPETSRLLDYIDNAICIFFLLEFSIRFYHAENKLKFMKWGWIDLVASIPTFVFLRPGRTLRLVRVIRILWAFRSVRLLIRQIFLKKAQGTFITVLAVAILMIIFSSIAMLQVEKDPESNIKTAEDAIWWAYATITTVGYGDKYPVTTEGRVVAACLMTAGLGLCGTFAGFVASWFVGEKKAEETAVAEEKSSGV